MNFYAVIVFFAGLAISNAGLYHGPTANILQGPSSKTTVVGPEGSVISAVAPGGQIVHEEHPGAVAHAAPVFGHVAPAVAYASHSVAQHVPIVAHGAHAVAYGAHAAPVAYAVHHAADEYGNTLVAGPSGTISTGHAHHGIPAVAYSGPVVANAYGHEGQYAHDYSEALYDDGSYKPHLYH